MGTNVTRIKVEVFSERGEQSRRVAFILGWGNRLHDRWLDWFREKTENENWSLMVIEIPDEYSDFKQVLREIENAAADHKSGILLCHSMGSIFGRYVSQKSIKRKIYFSPFWKIPRRTLFFGSIPLSRFVIGLLRWCKKPLLNRNFSESDVGSLDLPQDNPLYISPATMNTVMKAQRELPHLSVTDRVIYCPNDRVIDTSVCEGITYKGGHLAFCVPEREVILQKLIGLIAEIK